MRTLEALSRISAFSFPGRILRLPLRLVPRSAIVPVLTGINRGRRWIAGSASTNGSWIGTYESDHMASIKELVKPGMIVYDIGANVGFYTLAFSRLVGDAGRVFAFEPDARNAYMLRRHLELNRIGNVTFIQAAVSNVQGMVGFDSAREMGRISTSGTYQVPAISLDDFISLGNPIPAFVKMDVEGAECDALEGASTLLSRGVTAWMLATHGDDLRAQCRSTLARHGYRCRAFDCQSDVDFSPDFLAIPAAA